MLTLHDPSTNIAAERFNLNITSNNNTTNNSKNKRLRTLEHPSCDQEEIQASMRIMPSSFFFAEPRSMSKHTFAPGKPPIASTGIHMSAADVKTDMPRASLISPNSHPPSLAFAQTPDTPFSRHLQTRLAQQAGEICRLVDSQVRSPTTAFHILFCCGSLTMPFGNTAIRTWVYMILSCKYDAQKRRSHGKR